MHAVTTPAYQNHGSPPRSSGCIALPNQGFNQVYLIHLDFEGWEWPLVCQLYPQRPLDTRAGGLAFWSKMPILGLRVHSSEVALRHIVELDKVLGSFES